MPKLWTQTVESHRDAVRDATLDATAELVGERGLAAVTMAEIARRSGIGRATLYKYFPDPGSILSAWHERQVGEHLQQLVAIRDAAAEADRLEAVLTAFAMLSRGDHDADIAGRLHAGQHVSHAHHRLLAMLTELVAADARSGRVRSDVPAGELASYCLHALGSAGTLKSRAAVQRLVRVTLAGLEP